MYTIIADVVKRVRPYKIYTTMRSVSSSTYIIRYLFKLEKHTGRYRFIEYV